MNSLEITGYAPEEWESPTSPELKATLERIAGVTIDIVGPRISSGKVTITANDMPKDPNNYMETVERIRQNLFSAGFRIEVENPIKVSGLSLPKMLVRPQDACPIIGPDAEATQKDEGTTDQAPLKKERPESGS